MLHEQCTIKTPGPKKILKENTASVSNLAETNTFDTVLLHEDQNKTCTPSHDKVEQALDHETNEEVEETNRKERKIVAQDIVDETMIISKIDCDILAEEDNSNPNDGGLDYLKVGMFKEEKENSEGSGREIGAGNNECVTETFEEEEELEEGEEGSKEGDEQPEEFIEEFDDLEESDDLCVESEDGDEEFEEGDEESEEGDEQLKETDEQSVEYQEKENEERKKGNVDVVGGKSVEPNSEKVEASLKEVVDKLPGRKGKKLLKKIESGDKPKASLKRKPKRRVETMGMIFMCSSTTRSDCYHYRVLGLPASKKNVVEKIYKGMRLFLYDVDLKLLNGIYKAVGPGGYNIEPKAFNSQFPSQVRFTILDDCLPVAEEKFKKVIKDNYYTNTKFDCLLTSKQVKSLCKLFVRGQQNKRFVRSSKEAADEAKQSAGRKVVRYREHPRKRPRKAITSVVSVPPSGHSHGYDRYSAFEADASSRKPHFESHERHLDGRGLLLNRGDSYWDARDQPIEHFDSYRDGRDHRDYYRNRRDIPSDHRDPYRDGRDLLIQLRSPCRDRRDLHLQRPSPYRDGRDSHILRQSPYRNERDSYLQRQSPYRDERASYLQRRSPYRGERDSYLQRRSPYRERRNSDVLRRSPHGNGRNSDILHQSPTRNRWDLILDHTDPYRVGRDPYPGHGSPYRNRQEPYPEREHHNPYSDMQVSYLQLPSSFKDVPPSEPPDTYKRGPISDRHYLYRDERLAETHDLYERLRVPEPSDLETRQPPDIGSRDSKASYHLSYAEPKHSDEYRSRAVLGRDYHPVGPMTDLYSSRGQLPDYSYRRA